MDGKKLLKYLVFLMLFMFLVNLAASKFYLYYSLWYFDILMHFLGGVWVGLFFLYVFSRKSQVLPSELKITFFVLIIGILWEAFEAFSHNYIGRDSFNILDTFSDILFDLAGGLCAILYILVPLKNLRAGNNE